MELALSDFKIKAYKFLDSVFAQIHQHCIPVKTHWMIDHLCYRVATEAEYDKTKQQFLNLGDLLIESEVNGRLISTFKFFEPIQYRDWQIPLLELPAPKKGKPTKTDFEHIEIVCDIPFSEIKTQLKNCDVDISGLAKQFNQEFEVKLQDGAVKFHHLSLESVIRLEKNMQVYKALIESKVLTILKEYNPVVAGTFPLGVAVDNSDLDILCEYYDLKSLEELIKNHFGHFSGFKNSIVQGAIFQFAFLEERNIETHLKNHVQQILGPHLK